MKKNKSPDELPSHTKDVDGFPIAPDSTLSRLSAPPHFTLFPNASLQEFLRESVGKPHKNDAGLPFENDLVAGKDDPIYFAHYYSTKVPPQGIVPLLFHYTNPGDVVMDAFCGTGMTGIAAQMCNSSSLATQHGGKKGRRKAVLCDLSPTATFIASVTNRLASLAEALDEIDLELARIEKDFAELRRTRHVGWPRGADAKLRKNASNPPETYGEIEYVVWSDVYSCSSCLAEISHWDMVFRGAGEDAPDQLECPSCRAHLSTRKLDRFFIENYDFELGGTVKQVKQVPVLINYSIGTKRFEKYPDAEDLKVIAHLQSTPLANPIPVVELQEGFNTRQPRESHGFTHVHHFFSRRNLQLMAKYWARIYDYDDYKYQLALYVMTGAIQRICRLNRYMPNHDRHVGPLSGTLYVAPLTAEIPATTYMRERIKDLRRCTPLVTGEEICVSTQSATDLRNIPDKSIDYIFVDPPFGGNLNYSELNVLVEAWIQVRTSTTKEAIVNETQKKSLNEYRHLMREAFSEFYRVLKSNSWMTVEFHNSSNAVWNSIQEALGEAGFVIASVRILDKKKGTTKQLSYAATVKHDLMISAYKPSDAIERKIASAFDANALWDFVHEHLARLPLLQRKGGELHVVAERQPVLIFERLVGHCLRFGILVPLSAYDFYSQLLSRYSILDGMVFLDEQVPIYEKRKGTMSSVVQMSLFVQDEESAIQWLRRRLSDKPKTFQEIQPDFMSEARTWKKYETRPELSDLLEANFLRYDGTGDVPSQIHSYLSTNHKDLRGLEKNSPALVAKAKDRWYVPDPNKAQDLEKRREKALLKEFETYKSFTGRKIKESRLEVLRAGFRAAWAAKDYQTIISIANKLPEETLQEDEKLLTLYDLALTRTEDGI
jgi:DNA modification methylase